MTAWSENSMSAAADSGGTFDPDRLRLVTQHFRDLQGLSWVAIGLFEVFITNDALWSTGSVFLDLAEVGAAFGALIAAVIFIPRYYRWRFGWSEPCQGVRHPTGDWLLAGSIGLVGIVVVLVAWNYGNGIKVMFPVVLLALLCYVSLSRSTIVLLRRGYAIPIFLGAAFLTLYPILSPGTATHLAFWKSMERNVIWLVFVAMGLGDHILLLRLMPKRVADDGGERDE